jgi:hypothetical protein
LVALLWKATKRPSAERAGRELLELPCRPVESTLTRAVAWAAAVSVTPSRNTAVAGHPRGIDIETVLLGCLR